MESAKLNMKRLKNISLFRILLFGCIVFYFNSITLFFIFLLILFFDDRYAALFFILICALIFILNRYRIDFIPIGIVEAKKETYAVADKLFYKIKIYNAIELKEGDILFFRNRYPHNEYQTQLRKNLLFAGEGDYTIISSFFPRRFLREQGMTLSENSRNLIRKFLYNEYPENMPFDIGPGLASYFLFKKIRRRSAKLCLFLLVIFTIHFIFDIRFYLIIIDCICDIKRENNTIRSLFSKCLLLSMINLKLFENPSIQLTLLMDTYYSFSFSISFKTYLIMLFSFLFGESNLFGILFFGKLTALRILIIMLSFIVLLIPASDPLYSSIVKVFAAFNTISVPIRGSPSIMGLILFYYLCRKSNLKHRYLQLFLLILILVLPIHHPFSHVSFVDVGQGDAIVIRRPFVPSCILIDTGSAFNYTKLKKRLCKEGIYIIDYLIITHDDSDHNGNIERLKKDFTVKNTITEGRDISYGAFRLANLKMRDFENDNDNSLVFLLTVDDFSVLLTGDISMKAERELIRKYGPLSADILKVSHHGSRTGTGEELLSEILPDIAVISTSGQYDHPHLETIKRLDRYGVRWYTTQDKGTISFYTNRFFVFMATAKNEFVIMRS